MAIAGATVGIYYFSASGDSTASLGLSSSKTYLKHLRWVCTTASTAGDHLLVKDVNGNVLWNSYASGVYFIDVHPFHRYVDGIVAASMSSGILYAYLGQK